MQKIISKTNSRTPVGHSAEPEVPAPWLMHEFFAGSGLVGLGLAGMFSPAWANDCCPRKAETYRANSGAGAGHFVLGDVRETRGSSLPFAHLSWASFPCQDLSLAGSMSGIEGERSGLVWEWLRIVRESAEGPAVLVMENVMGLITACGGDHYRRLHLALAEAGYRAGAVVLDAVRFLPHSRPRVFVIALKAGTPLPGDLVSGGPTWLHPSSAASLGAELPEWIWWNAPEPPPRQSDLSDILEDGLPFDKDHVLGLLGPRHRAALNARDTLTAAGYRRTRGGRQTLELRFDGVAGCLRTPYGGSSRQFLVVKRKGRARARLISPRETARLMGAPESFRLPSRANEGYRAMGDAVALPVATFLGRHILTRLAEAAYGPPCRS
ncbi:MAG: DNA cytosine methyltransferase [Deltaproteobacteria bacterium]|jgi:DNA (cytosine-5)-methyltransferase 1|nr:DNA cytosine methyltransferase [Deltaproteobacteria bacterium]